MQTKLKGLLEKIKGFFKKLNKKALILLGICLVVVLAVVIALVLRMNQKEYAVLYTGLTAAETNTVVGFLSDQGMTRYAAKERPTRAGGQEHYRFDCKNVAVAVVGSQSRIGTTTAAVGLSAWLARVGASVCYVETHADGHLAALARGYEMEAEEGGWQFEGVHYRSNGAEGRREFCGV